MNYIKVNSDMMSHDSSMSNKTVYVTSDNPIVIYGLNKAPYSTDGYLQLPTTALGRNYIIACHKTVFESEFLLVGVHDSTEVTIIFPAVLKRSFIEWNGTRYHKNDNLTLTINRFEAVQFKSKGDLIGTHVVANKDIGVYGGNTIEKIGPGAADHLVEMLPSVDKWGKKFVTSPLPERHVGDNFCFLASEDATTITMSGECSGTVKTCKSRGLSRADN